MRAAGLQQGRHVDSCSDTVDEVEGKGGTELPCIRAASAGWRPRAGHTYLQIDSVLGQRRRQYNVNRRGIDQGPLKQYLARRGNTQ